MSLSRSIVNNAGARDPKTPRTIFVKGERRAERYPSGKMERFVDLQGNVVQVQMVQPGVHPTPETVARKRAQLHNAKNHDKTIQAFIEHDKCPLRHGLRHLSATTEEEFASLPPEMQRPCETDPRVAVRTAKGLEYNDPCPHVLWLQGERRKREDERRQSRRTQARNYQAEQLEIAKVQAEESRKVADKLASVVETLAAKPRRPSSE